MRNSLRSCADEPATISEPDMFPALYAIFRTITGACTSNMSFWALNAEFTQIMRGLTCNNLGTRYVSSTIRNFQNYHRGLYIKYEFLGTKCGIHSDHARINLQQSRNPGCYLHQTQFLKLSPGPVHQMYSKFVCRKCRIHSDHARINL